MLLELERVGKRARRGAPVALEDLSLRVDAGEMVVVLGARRSGRSTLLRIAAEVEAPETGRVLFEGRDLAARGVTALGTGIGFCRREFRPYGGRTVRDQLVAGQLVRRVTQADALTRAWRALERAGAAQWAAYEPGALKTEEAMRVAIARALTSDPCLLVVDEPTLGVKPLERDQILKLLRSLADEGITVLASAGDGTELLGADRVLSLRAGRLHGELEPGLAPVTRLRAIR